jgi:hypothetical protein
LSDLEKLYAVYQQDDNGNKILHLKTRDYAKAQELRDAREEAIGGHKQICLIEEYRPGTYRND